jgi:hypothetical protein
MAAIIELYEDQRSGWRVLTSQQETTGYRFIIVDRFGRHTFAEDARELTHGNVPAGLEQVDLSADSPHGMELHAPCAMWRRGRVQRTGVKLGVLTEAYVKGVLTHADQEGDE